MSSSPAKSTVSAASSRSDEALVDQLMSTPSSPSLEASTSKVAEGRRRTSPNPRPVSDKVSLVSLFLHRFCDNLSRDDSAIIVFIERSLVFPVRRVLGAPHVSKGIAVATGAV
jgi:hypothetical protein